MAKSPSRERIGAAAALEGLPGRSPAAGRRGHCRRYKSKDFNAAFGFMTPAARAAERLGDGGAVRAMDAAAAS